MRPPYRFDTSQSGLTFLAIGLGVLLGGLTGVLIDHFIYQAKHRLAMGKGETHAAPEHRLYNAMMGSWGILVGLFWVGWSAARGTHWAVVLVGSVPFAWGNLCLFVSRSYKFRKQCRLTKADECRAVHDGCVWPFERRQCDRSERHLQVHAGRCVSALYSAE